MGWLTSDQKALMRQQVVRPAVFFRIAASPTPVRVWAGDGDFIIPADSVEDAPATYIGAGDIISLPAVQHLINGQSARIDFSVSGVSAQHLALADAEAGSVRERAFLLGVMFLGPDLQPAAAMLWAWEGTVDQVGGRRDGDTRSVSLSVGSGNLGRRRPNLGYFTDADQRARSPTDRFCEHVAGYSLETTKKWPS